MQKILLCSDISQDSNQNDIYDTINNYNYIVNCLKDINALLITDIEVLKKDYSETFFCNLEESIKVADLIIFDVARNPNEIMSLKMDLAKKYNKKMFVITKEKDYFNTNVNNQDYYKYDDTFQDILSNMKNAIFSLKYKKLGINLVKAESLNEFIAIILNYCKKYNLDGQNLKQHFYSTIYRNEILINIVNKGKILERLIIPFDYLKTQVNMGKIYFCDALLNNNYNLFNDNNIIKDKTYSLKKVSSIVAIN